MITWSVWVSIQVRNLTRSAWLWPGWSPASANAHPAYRGGVQVPCVRHPLALLCATSMTTSTSRWDENAAGCLIWRRYHRLAGRHAVWMSASGPADRPQAPRPGLPADELESSLVQQLLCRIAYVEYDSGDRQAAEAAGDELLGHGAS